MTGAPVEQVEPLVLDLDDARAGDSSQTGGKAANLALARAGGMRTQPGFAVTTRAHLLVQDAGGALPEPLVAALREPWRQLARDGGTSLVVRSSSTIEDAESSSMAGQFRSVLDVRGWDAFLDAVLAVLASAHPTEMSAGPHDRTSGQPMGLLVQPHMRPDCGGVLFGVDPVSGDADQIVVEAVAGGPESLVSGRAAAQQYVLSRHGRLRSIDHRRPREHARAQARGRLLDRHRLHRLAELSRKAEATFGAPQDIEWAFDRSGELWLLQSRPVTATGQVAAASGPVLGPGPVAETFPDPLRPLEEDLWVRPLREGIREALTVTRAAPPDKLAGSPVVTVVEGRVAADLALFGYVGQRGMGWRILDPRVGGRRLRAAWQVGWLRSTLPQQVADTVSDTDSRLAAVPCLDTLNDVDLVALLESSEPLLRGLHRDEVFAGTLLPAGRRTAAALGLAALEIGRAQGYTDAQVVRRSPVVLALVPPRVGQRATLPPASAMGGGFLDLPDASGRLGPREALRLRARWVQELTARAAATLGRRWAQRGLLEHAEQVALLRSEELTAMASGECEPPTDLADREAHAAALLEIAPLPAQFRLAPDGTVVPTGRAAAGEGMGVGAGGGRGAGPVCHASPSQPPGQGDVLVVRSLDPGLAPWLPGLSGLVSETGSTLSHLAILAREYHVPTVVAVPDALRRFPPGTKVLVDGTTGEIARLDGIGVSSDEVSA